MMRPPMLPPTLPPSRPVNPLASAGVALALVIGVLVGVPIAVVVVVTLWTPAWRFADVLTLAIERAGALLGFAVLGCVFAGALLVLRRLYFAGTRAANEAHKVRVTKLQNGMPVDILDLRDVTRSTLQPGLAAHYQVERAKASRQFPELRSYHHTNQVRNDGAPALLEGAPAAPAPVVPSFAELLDQGAIGPGRPLCFGYSVATGQPMVGAWSKLYSVGLGGMTGSGKTWAAAWLLAQSAAAGAKLLIVDPHTGDDESLSNRLQGLSASFVCDVAQSGAQIESALKLASRELEQRKNGAHAQHQLILICDEWTSLLRYGKLGELLTATALDIAEQGRKYGLFCCLCAQAWNVDAAGPVRDRLASHFVLRTRADQFRMQTGIRGAAPEDVMTLAPGQAYFLSTAGEVEKITIPRMNAADLARIGSTVKRPIGFQPATKQATGPLPQATLAMAAHAPVVANGKPDGSQMVANTNQATTAVGRAKPSPEAKRAADLFLSGQDMPQIVKELRGVSSNQGRRYQTALQEITALVRDGIGGQ